MTEPVASFGLANLTAAAAVVAVLALRVPARRLFGARVAYGLWLLVPLAALAVLLPARTVVESRVVPPAPEIIAVTSDDAVADVAAPSPPRLQPGLAAAWALGALAAFIWLGRSQAHFARAVRAGRAGPAAVGVLKPRIVTPDDFESRYTPRERQMILAHEATHIARQDPRINALVAAARCLAWFNPLVHLAARALRVDQELACDAQVVAAHPQARRTYAEAMLKTQLAAKPLPLGCYWAQPAHPLAQRVSLLARAAPSPPQQLAGALAITALTLATALAVWSARPPQIVIRPILAPSPIASTAPAQAARPPEPVAATAPTRAPAPAEPAVEDAAPPAFEATPVVETPPPPPEPAYVRRINGAAERSHVEPGSAVRVLATMVDPDGHTLVTDLTAYGSQSRFRTGRIEREGSRYALYTAVEQDGDQLVVTASLGPGFLPLTSGRVTLASGETGTIRLASGQTVTVTPTLRAETDDELDAGRRMAARMAWSRLQLASFEGRDPYRCGRLGAIC